MAESNESVERARKMIEEDRKALEQRREQSEFDHAAHSRAKPTPTQEENDLAMYGAHIVEHEDDGSGPDVNRTRQVEASRAPAKPASYQTKSPAQPKAE